MLSEEQMEKELNYFKRKCDVIEATFTSMKRFIEQARI
jgi:hypothetical protein